MNDYKQKIPENLKDDIERLEQDYGIVSVEPSEDEYKVKLKDRDQGFQSANLTYGEKGFLDEVVVVPNVNESFSKAKKVEDEIEKMLER